MWEGPGERKEEIKPKLSGLTKKNWCLRFQLKMYVRGPVLWFFFSFFWEYSENQGLLFKNSRDLTEFESLEFRIIVFEFKIQD